MRAAPVLLAAALLAPAPPAAAAELGRLFFTPQQRQDLDRRRQTNAQESVVTVESLITVSGHVSRSGGKTTTWINGVPQDDAHRGREPAQVTVQPSEGEAPVPMRVGQTLDRVRGEVREGFGAGEVKVIPAAKSGPPARPARPTR